MAAALYNTSNKEGVDINSVFILDTGTPEYPRPPFIAGDQAYGTDGSAWVYCTASITIASGSVVLISTTMNSYSVALVGGSSITASGNVQGMLVGVVGGSQGSLVVPAPTGTQTGTYFWVQRLGNCPNVKMASGGAAVKLAQLYSNPTLSGVISSTAGGAGTTYQINGLVVSNTNGSAAGPNTAVLNWPVVGSGA